MPSLVAREESAITHGEMARRLNRTVTALRYERALVYEGLGQDQRARTELEKLYAEAPEYEDVAARLRV